jgi:hypothetical protein
MVLRNWTILERFVFLHPSIKDLKMMFLHSDYKIVINLFCKPVIRLYTLSRTFLTIVK